MKRFAPVCCTCHRLGANTFCRSGARVGQHAGAAATKPGEPGAAHLPQRQPQRAAPYAWPHSVSSAPAPSPVARQRTRACNEVKYPSNRLETAPMAVPSPDSVDCSCAAKTRSNRLLSPAPGLSAFRPRRTHFRSFRLFARTGTRSGMTPSGAHRHIRCAIFFCFPCAGQPAGAEDDDRHTRKDISGGQVPCLTTDSANRVGAIRSSRIHSPRPPQRRVQTRVSLRPPFCHPPRRATVCDRRRLELAA